MADGDGSAVHVELLHRDAQTVAAVNYLHGESFIEFPEINVFSFQTLAPQQPGYSKNWSDTHFIRFAAGDLEAAENQM